MNMISKLLFSWHHLGGEQQYCYCLLAAWHRRGEETNTIPLVARQRLGGGENYAFYSTHRLAAPGGRKKHYSNLRVAWGRREAKENAIPLYPLRGNAWVANVLFLLYS